jgi:protein transport protein SEC31
MVRLREIPRTAAFTWSPGASTPFLATGTKAGAVDADFSSDTQLELWDLDLDNVTRDKELKPAASIATDSRSVNSLGHYCQSTGIDFSSRFHDIAWVQSKDGPRRGVIAGALESGSLDLWDVDKLLRGEEYSNPTPNPYFG